MAARQAKYVEIENYIKHAIETQMFNVGDKLPTEKELSGQFDTTVLTVNKAMKNLENVGYLKRIQGKGSFVTKHSKLQKQIGSFNSFTKSMEKYNKKIGSILCDYRMLKGSEIPEIAEMLDCTDDDLIHYFERIRTGDDEKVALSYTYLPYKIINSFDIKVLDGSLHNYLSNIGIESNHYDIEISSQMPTKEQRKSLEIGTNSPLLVNKIILYMEPDIPFEYVETYYIGSRFTYSASFHSN